MVNTCLIFPSWLDRLPNLLPFWFDRVTPPVEQIHVGPLNRLLSFLDNYNNRYFNFGKAENNLLTSSLATALSFTYPRLEVHHSLDTLLLHCKCWNMTFASVWLTSCSVLQDWWVMVSYMISMNALNLTYT